MAPTNHLRPKMIQLLGWLMVIFFIQWFLGFPELIQRFYTERLFVWITKPIRFVSGLFPFAIGELVYIIVIIVLIINSIKYFILNKYSIKEGIFWGILCLDVGILFSRLYFVFMLLWGLNYYKPDPSEAFHLKVNQGYTIAEVDSLSLELIQEMNQSRAKISDTEIAEFQINPYLPNVKKALFPSLGDKIGYLAFYQPLTGEAIIRNDLPQLLMPFTLEHEKAHQKGYASETEANFIAFVKADSTSDLLMKYSMQLQIFSYAQNATLWLVAKKGDYKLWKQIAERNKQLVSPKVLEDRKQIRAFFAKRQDARIPGTDKLYDQFLQWNNQAKGLESYDDVIRWVLAYRKSKTDSSTSYSQ